MFNLFGKKKTVTATPQTDPIDTQSPDTIAPPETVEPPEAVADPAPMVPAEPLEPIEEIAPPVEAPKGWFARMRDGLARSSARLTDGIGAIFTTRKLNADTLEQLEELLITADLGPATAAKLTAALSKERFGKDTSPDDVKAFLAQEITTILTPVAQPLVIDATRKPFVILMVGVNGAGKTTTLGKLANIFRAEGKSVMIAAGDTFRAAAVEQLKVWGQRAGVPVIAKETGADAAGLAFEALEQARAAQADVLLIDTAGRLQNRGDLMAELQKIVRVLKKQDATAPHATLLVLDATTGQNAHSQVDIFRSMVDVNGLIVTKLDGSAKGGVLVSLAEKFGLPVHAIGVGESLDDLRPFQAAAFAAALTDLDGPKTEG